MKFSGILNLLLVPAFLGAAAFGVVTNDKLKNANENNDLLNQTNITIKAENESLKQTILDLENQLSSSTQTSTKTYTLENEMQFSHILQGDVLHFESDEELTAYCEGLITKASNGEPLYKDYVFTYQEDSANYAFEYSDGNIYLLKAFGNDADGNIVEMMMGQYKQNEINLIDGLNYEVGKSYELTATPEYLDETMKFECIDKTDTTIKFKTAGSFVETVYIDGDIDFEVINGSEIYNVVKITKNENEIIIKSYANQGYGLTETSTNTITLNS